jgi:molecular chaperone DnaJ
MEEIKKSFRKLAHEYHPDKNQQNVFAEARFREIHEAYQTLSNAGKRSLYNQERWLSGRFSKKTTVITPQYLQQEVQKLNAHLAEVDVYRMNKELLYRYLMFLLSDDKIGIILQKAEDNFASRFVPQILEAIAPLPHYFAKDVLLRLKAITADNEAENTLLVRAIRKRAIEEQKEKWFPWIIFLVTLLLCLAMYLFSKR